MNAAQRRTIARRYFSVASQELNGKLWDTDMDLHEESTWAYCRFLSKRKSIIYIMAIYTGAQVYHDIMFDRAYDDVVKDMDSKTEQAVEIMAKVKARMQDMVMNEPAPSIWEEIKTQPHCTKHRFGQQSLYAVVNVPIITEEVVTNLVSEFLSDKHQEECYYRVRTIEFDKQTMIQYLDPFKLIRDS